MSELGERLSEFRKRTKKSQEDVAKNVGVSAKTIGRIEAGGEIKRKRVRDAIEQLLVAADPGPGLTLYARDDVGRVLTIGVLHPTRAALRVLFGDDGAEDEPVKFAESIREQESRSSAPAVPSTPPPRGQLPVASSIGQEQPKSRAGRDQSVHRKVRQKN